MTERFIDYPYIPGSYGIPFSDLLGQFATKDVHSGTIFGGSGRELDWRIELIKRTLYLTVQDRADPYYQLEAGVDTQRNVAEFTLFTRQQDGILPHPDMFARRFIGVTLDFFQSIGREVKCCKGWWIKEDRADNYWQFIDAYRASRSKSLAARQTWSGRAFSDYGFTEIEDKDVIIKKEGPDDIEIHAYFWKPGRR